MRSMHKCVSNTSYILQAISLNGMSEKVSVVNRDVAKLQRAKDIRRQGVNIVIADMFDSGI